MKTIALVTQKGGSGKSVLAASLAVEASKRGEVVVALDLDPQASLASWGDDRKSEKPVVDRLDYDRIPRLPTILAGLRARGFTIAILDCPGVSNTATNTAMKVADLCLVPTRPTRLDIRATRPTVQTLMGLKRPFAFVLNQCPSTSRSTRAGEAAEGLKMLGALAEPYIGSRADFQDAMACGQGVTEYAVTGKAADEIEALWAWVKKQLEAKGGQ